jgi:integrase/recombinase XerC
MAALHDDHKKTSIARKLASLRTFFQFLIREGKLESNPAKLVATPKIERKAAKPPVDGGCCPVYRDAGHKHRSRPAATGPSSSFYMRRAFAWVNLTSININDVDFRERMVRVTGKRKKQRIVPFGEPAAQAVMLYIEQTRGTFLNNCPEADPRSAGTVPKLPGHSHHDPQRWPNDRQIY